MTSLVGFCGSRSLPISLAPRLAGVVGSVLSSRRSLAVGCCRGVDAAVVRQVLRLGAASRLSVFAAFGPVSSAGIAPGSSSAVSSVSSVARASAAGASVSWWSGGGEQVPLPGRLASRSAALVFAVSSSGPGAGLVCFVSSDCPPHLRPSPSPSTAFSGHGSGSWGSLALAVGLGLPVVVFPFCASGYGLGPALPGPSSWGGSWSPVVQRPALSPWVGSFRFVPDSPALLYLSKIPAKRHILIL